MFSILKNESHTGILFILLILYFLHLHPRTQYPAHKTRNQVKQPGPRLHLPSYTTAAFRKMEKKESLFDRLLGKHTKRKNPCCNGILPYPLYFLQYENYQEASHGTRDIDDPKVQSLLRPQHQPLVKCTS